MKRFSSRQYAAVLLDLLETTSGAKRSAAIRGFLTALRRRRQMRLLPRIVDTVETLDLHRRGAVRVHARVARPLSAALTASVKRLTGKDIVLTTATDSSLIGGVQLRIEETFVDASIPTVLRDLRRHLTNA